MASSTAKTHDKAGEVLEVGSVVCSARTIATHVRPDLDAVLAVWICQRIRKHAGLSPARVVFLPASETSIDGDVFAIAVGKGKGIVPCGSGKSLRKSSIGGSASMAVFRALSEADRDVLATVVQAISDEDETGTSIHVENLKTSGSKGEATRWESRHIREPIMATTIWSAFEFYSMAVLDDEKILETWSAVFDGLLASGLKKREADHASSQAELKFNGRLAILPHGAPQEATKLAFKSGALVVVFSSFLGHDKWTLGVVKKTGEEARFIDFHDYQTLLRKYVPDIFVHEGGFLAGWTVKAPLTCGASEFRDRQSALILAVNELMRIALAKGL